MKEEKNHLRFSVLIGFVAFATASRLLSPAIFGNAFNIAPMDAIALFSGAYFFRKWAAFLIPLFSIWVSDFFVNYIYTGVFQPVYPGFYWQYGSYMLIVLIGFMLQNNIKPFKVIMASISASALFFIVSNFGVWAGGILYPINIGGLMACYVAAIPFFAQTLLSDLVFAGILFGGFEFAKLKFPALLRHQPKFA